MVGSRKNKADKWLPPRVYRGRSAYEWHPKGGGNVRLCSLEAVETDAVKAKVWQRYSEEVERLTSAYTVSDLIASYFASPQFLKRLSPRTQSDYRRYSIKTDDVFGKMEPRHVRPYHIRRFMDRMGVANPVTANRHHSFLSILLGWALERGLVDDNPAKSVRKFQEKPRPRYVEDWEYDLVYQIAAESGSPYMAPMMEFAYLCRMRAGEIRALTENHILDAGIMVERAKGSNNEVTAWSPRLHTAVKLARSLYPKAPTLTTRPLIHNAKGQPIADSTYKTAWSRIMAKALKGDLKERFHFHDLKAKGVTDHVNKASGHKTKKAHAVYNRRPDQVDSTR